MHLSGLLNIDKPPGLTSHDVVAQIRRLLTAHHPPSSIKVGLVSSQPQRVPQNPSSPPLIRGESVVDPPDKGDDRGFYRQALPKVGHTGTLDPFATGILLIAIGSATRLIEYSHAWDKTYQAVFILGASSDTDDTTGQISKTAYPKSQTSIKPTKTQIQTALHQFIGPIKQVPPAFSAAKIAGERAYKIARRGISPSLQPRPITIHSLTITKYNYPKLWLAITCSTGTYIRSLARDLGNALSVGAYVENLRRTKIGPHQLTQSINLKNLTAEQLTDALLPPTALISHLPQITLTDDNVAQFIQGQTIGEQGTAPNHENIAFPYHTTQQSLPAHQTSLAPSTTTFAIFNESSAFIGIAQKDPLTHLLHPIKVLIN